MGVLKKALSTAVGMGLVPCYVQDIPKLPGRIFLLACHWLGDTFWAMQVIPALRRTFPDAELHVGCKSFSRELFHGLLPPERVHTVNSVLSDRHREKADHASWACELESLRVLHFDLALDLTGNRYSCWFLCRLGIPTAGLDLHFLSPLYSLRGPAFDYRRHLHFRPWETVRLLCDCDVSTPLFPVLSSLPAEAILAELGVRIDERLALLAPGAGWPEKQWHMDNFITCGSFLAALGLRVVIAGSQREKDLCVRVAAGISKAVVLNGDLQRTISIFPKLQVALTNDSGLAHLLAAANVPLVSIYLITNPEQCGPIGKQVSVLSGKNLSASQVQHVMRHLLLFPPHPSCAGTD